MLSAQVDNGGGLPLVKVQQSNAGHENTLMMNLMSRKQVHLVLPCRRCLWFFPDYRQVYRGESGNKEFLDEVIVYANGGEDSVYNHLKTCYKLLNGKTPQNVCRSSRRLKRLYETWQEW